MGNVICGVDKNGNVVPLGAKYDYGTGLASLAISRGAGKQTFSQHYAASVGIGTSIITPPSGKKLCIASVYCSGDGTTGSVILRFFTSDLEVFYHFMSKYNTSFTSDMHIEGAADEPLKLTSNTGETSMFLAINYRIVD